MKELLVASNLTNDAIWCKLYHPLDKKIKYHLTSLGFHYHGYGYANKNLPCIWHFLFLLKLMHGA